MTNRSLTEREAEREDEMDFANLKLWNAYHEYFYGDAQFDFWNRDAARVVQAAPRRGTLSLTLFVLTVVLLGTTAGLLLVACIS